MHSAFRLIGADSSNRPASVLFAALNDLLRAVDGRVVLLRSLPSRFDCRQDDIDLMLTSAQRLQLMRAAFSQCIRGRIHCRIQQSSAAKAQMILWTIDCSQLLIVDLWSGFDQLPRHRQHWIPADRLLRTLSTADSVTRSEPACEEVPADRRSDPIRHGAGNAEIPALRQLAPDISLCLLIQHLATKRKMLTTSATHERLIAACERLKAWSPAPESEISLLSALRDVAEQLPRAMVIAPTSVELSEVYLLQRLASSPLNRGLPLLERRQRRGLVTECRQAVLRKRPTIAFIGSDGAGKSSVITALKMEQPNFLCGVAKKYYRRSLAYQLASGLMRRLCGLDRGVFDNYVSPLITLRAAVGMWTRMCLPWKAPSVNSRSLAVAKDHIGDGSWKTPRRMLLDRSFSGFLITDRKSDSPRLARMAAWIESVIPPVTSVLLTLPYVRLKDRKQEMSPPGHETYQHMLFEQALRQRPVDLIMTASLASAETTAAAVSAMLQTEACTLQQPFETPDQRKAAA